MGKKISAEDTSKIKAIIINRIAIDMLSLRKVCLSEDIPSMTKVLEWLKEDQEFAMQYARACDIRHEGLADEILDIADDSSRDTKIINKGGEDYEIENTEWVNRSKLRVDSRKWLLSKLAPKKYGDKIAHELSGKIQTEQITGMKIE